MSHSTPPTVPRVDLVLDVLMQRCRRPQALVAASSVNDEPVNSDFNSVVGLALALNSAVAQKIPPATSDAPDNAFLSTNIFGITPAPPRPPPVSSPWP
ncbi:hypothetical protein C8Q78DRAFT_1083294 [Trametes maxima]|nr:hypothetical protein C8Q78DRAFT_1083294 [Trametes maxima]